MGTTEKHVSPREAVSPPRIGLLLRLSILLWLLISVGYLYYVPRDKLVIAALFLLFAPLWIGIAIIVAIKSFRCMRAKDRRTGVLLALVPIATIGLYFFGRDIADTARFQVERADMLRTIEANRAADDAPFLYYFHWDGLFEFEHGVLFDESGEITKSPAERSVPWKQKVPYCFYPGRLLGDYFYLVYSDNGCYEIK